MASDIGLGPQAPQFLEAQMVDEEWEAFEEIMEDGGGILAENFMANLVLHAPGAHNEEPQIQDVVYKDELQNDSNDDEEDLFDLF